MEPIRGVSWALIVAAGAFVLGCQGSGQSLPVLRIGHAPHDHHAALYVAASVPEHFESRYGVFLREVVPRTEYLLTDHGKPVARVVIDSSVGGKELIRRLAQDQFDLAFGGFPAMVEAIDHGGAIRVVAPVMTGGAGLVVRRDSPFADWEGFLAYVRSRERPVRVGYKSAVSVQGLVFERALHRADITHTANPQDTAAQIRLVNLHGPQNLLPALENDLIDGFVVMQPFLALAEEAGTGKVVALLDQIPGDDGAAFPCCALAAREDYLEREPRAAALMVDLLLHASRYIEDHPAQAAAVVASWLGVSPQVEGKALPTIHFVREFDQAWEEGVRRWVESMVASGLLDGRVRDAWTGDRLEDVVYDARIHRKTGRGP